MAEYSEQDLRYASQLRESVHREALAIVRKTLPDARTVDDPHPVEDYFQEQWDYPGRWYTVVAIPGGYGSRKALVDAIVRGTLASLAPAGGCPDGGDAAAQAQEGCRRRTPCEPSGIGGVPCPEVPDTDPFYELIAAYPDCAAEYCIVTPDAPTPGAASHRAALKTAWQTRFVFGGPAGLWRGDPSHAAGTQIPAEALFAPEAPDGSLTYRSAFLRPPHGGNGTDKDFARVNAALFPNGTDGLEVYRWTTDWSDFFDEGHEWWGTLCLTVYDEKSSRFVVIMASATD